MQQFRMQNMQPPLPFRPNQIPIPNSYMNDNRYNNQNYNNRVQQNPVMYQQ